MPSCPFNIKDCDCAPDDGCSKEEAKRAIKTGVNVVFNKPSLNMHWLDSIETERDRRRGLKTSGFLGFDGANLGPLKPGDVLKKPDEVDHPKHYTAHPSGVECIAITEHMNFNLGNAVKYIWRASLKGKQKQDLEKAIWYLQRELKRLFP